MGKIDPKRIPNTMKLFQVDLPALICAVGLVEDNEEYWSEVHAQCNIVYEKHKNELAKSMVLDIAEYLEKQSKKMKNRT